MRSAGWWLGTIPVFAHLIVLLLCYKIARSMDQWWLWHLVWFFAGLSSLAYLIGRTYNLAQTYLQHVPPDFFRIGSASVGAYSFLAMCIAAFGIFRKGRRQSNRPNKTI